MKPIVLCAAIMLAAVGAAWADGLDPIAVRQAGFSLQGSDYALISSVVKAKGDVKPLEKPAQAIAKWAAVIPTLFPKGTETGENTKALPEIWSDPDGFRKIAMTLQANATKLATAAKAGNADEVATDLKAVGSQCGACHKNYRAK